MKNRKVSDILMRGIENYPVVRNRESWVENSKDDDINNTPCGCVVGTILLETNDGRGQQYTDMPYSVKGLLNKSVKGVSPKYKDFNKSCGGSNEFGENTLGKFINYLFVVKKLTRIDIYNTIKEMGY